MKDIFKNNKTGNYYKVVSYECLDATNSNNDPNQKYVAYHDLNLYPKYYVRKYEEFFEKFSETTCKDCKFFINHSFVNPCMLCDQFNNNRHFKLINNTP